MYNKKFKKTAALLLSAVMMFSLTACGGNGKKEQEPAPAPTQGVSDGDSKDPAPQGGDSGVAKSDEKRVIRIGTWYDHYYSSKDKDIYDDPAMNNPETAQMRLDTVRRIEETYNVEIEYVNLTWEGIIESINTSIMAGTPDCDIYEVDLQFGVPAALNGYGMALEDFLDGGNDVFADQQVFKNLKIADADKSYLFAPSSMEMGAYPLGFNMDLIDAANLENPQDLYDRGEWTWQKFQEYLKVLTKDNDGDGVIDVYGYGGYHTNMSDCLLMSNGAHVAGGTTQQLNSPETIEVLDFMYQLYQVDKTARPWNPDSWDENVSCYTEGKVAFWTTAAWLQNNFGTSAQTGFEIGIVPWPIGPSGNKETNSQIKVAGNYFMIPVGVERPELVYQVIYELTNWYDGDTSLRDETEWFEDQMETERNFAYLVEMGKTAPWFDLWQSISDFAPFYGVIAPTDEEVLTPAQAAEQYKQIAQDYLDVFLK